MRLGPGDILWLSKARRGPLTVTHTHSPPPRPASQHAPSPRGVRRYPLRLIERLPGLTYDGVAPTGSPTAYAPTRAPKRVTLPPPGPSASGVSAGVPRTGSENRTTSEEFNV